MAVKYLKNTSGIVASDQLSTANLRLFPNAVTISNTTYSFGPTTGALVVFGGVGIGQDLNVVGNISGGNLVVFSGNFTTNVIVGDTLTTSTIRNTGTIYSAGGQITNINSTSINTTEFVTGNLQATNKAVISNLYATYGLVTTLESTSLNTSNFNSTYANVNILAVDSIVPRNYSQINLGDINKLNISGGAAGQTLITDGNGNLTWSDGTNALLFDTGLRRVGNTVSLAGTGGSPGVYDRVTVDEYGRVVSGESVTDTLEVVTQRGSTTSQQILISNGTDSYDVDQGALIVTGGVGIGATLTAAMLDVKGTALFEDSVTAEQNLTVNQKLILDGANHGQVPLTINVGNLSSSPELGSIEFDGDYIYVTTNIGRQIIQARQSGSTSTMVFSVRAVATININISNPSQTSNGTDNWENVILNAFDRVLLTAQTSASENGIYIWRGAGQALTRSTDFNILSGIYSGSSIIVTEGVISAGTIWTVATTNPISVGSTNIIISHNFNQDTIALSKLVKDTTAGLITRTQYGTIAMRSVVSNTSWLTVSNGTGKLGNITLSTSVIPVTSGGTGRSAWFGYLKGVGASINSSNTVPRADIVGLGTMADQNANAVVITGGNLSNIGNIVTANITVTNLTTTQNLVVNSTITTSTVNTDTLSVANLNVTGAVGISNLFGNAIQLGANSKGSLTTNAISVSTTENVTDTIALMNTVLGKLVPPPPPAFPASQSISISGLSSYRMTNFSQTDNTTNSRSAAAGAVVSNIRRSASYSTNNITTAGPGDTGRITVYKNNTDAGYKDMVGGINGTFSDLIITSNQDYHNVVSAVNSNFWYSFNAQASGTSLAGWNDVYIRHTGAGNTNVVSWYYDSSTPGAPTFTNPTITIDVADVIYSSTVPHYTSNTRFDVSFNIAKLSGDTYPTSDTFITGTAGGAFQTPVSVNYSGAGISTPLARNLYVSSGSQAITTKSNIVSGFGSSSSGPSLTADNSYSTTTQAFSPGFTILYKTGTGTQIEETSIPVNTVGTGSGNAVRVVNPGSGDTPTFSASATAFNSQTGTLNTYDATVVAAVLKHDQTNYASGYYPVGPNLSLSRSSAQYFTLKFIRTVVSKFNVKYTGTLAGLWVALPGSSIDASSTLNGWLDMSLAYNGAGVPGSRTNGSNGCAVGGTATLNSAVTNKNVTATFGTVSSTSTATNEIYVRIKLTSGQSLTALSIEAATN